MRRTTTTQSHFFVGNITRALSFKSTSINTKKVLITCFIALSIYPAFSQNLFTAVNDSVVAYKPQSLTVGQSYKIGLGKKTFEVSFQNKVVGEFGTTFFGQVKNLENSQVVVSVSQNLVDLTFELEDSDTYYTTFLGKNLYKLHKVSSDAQKTHNCSIEEQDSTAPKTTSQIFRLEATDTAWVDVLVLYTPKAKQLIGGREAIVLKAMASINSTNRVYASSGVNARLRLVHTRETLQEGSGNLASDLGDLMNTRDGQFDEIASLREYAAADLVTLFAGEDRHYMRGIAQIPTDSTGGHSNRCFSVCFYSTASGVFPHEVTHNFGCQHNKKRGGSRMYPYSYGHSWYDNGTLRGSIMSYDGKRVALLSSPTVFFNGNPTGVDNEADNARTVRKSSQVIQHYRTAKLLVDLEITLNAQLQGQKTVLTANLKNLRPQNLVSFPLALSLPQGVRVAKVTGGNWSTAAKTITINTLAGNGQAQVVIELLSNFTGSDSVSLRFDNVPLGYVDFDFYNDKPSILAPFATYTNGISVNISQPTSGGVFQAPANVTINADASDAGGQITKVAFYNSTKLLIVDSIAPYSFQWKNIPVGKYDLKAIAYDNSGANSVSSIVKITVSQLTTVADEMESDKEQIKVYPIPFEHTFHLERTNGEDIQEVVVYASDGSVAKRFRPTNTSQLEMGADLPNGAYWLHVSTTSFTKLIKIVKINANKNW